MANDTAKNLQTSTHSIYSQFFKKRKQERDEKEERRRLEKEAKKASRKEREEENEGSLKTKKEIAAERFENWQSILIGLTGEDLDYLPQKKSRKKYRKWIDEETDNLITTAKAKKKKKKNYNKEFEPELNMLRSIVADQNRFTSELAKRLQVAAGPATKDAGPINKTHVDLISALNHSRSNSLGMVNAISNIKKSIADLYFKQKKEDRDSGAAGFDSTDVAMLGSNIAAEMFGSSSNPVVNSPVALGETPVPHVHQPNHGGQPGGGMVFPRFDPTTWDGGDVDAGATAFENIPKKIVVEFHKNSDRARFKALRLDDGSEIIGCPVPKSQIKKFDTDNKMASDEFDQTYELEIHDD